MNSQHSQDFEQTLSQLHAEHIHMHTITSTAAVFTFLKIISVELLNQTSNIRTNEVTHRVLPQIFIFLGIKFVINCEEWRHIWKRQRSISRIIVSKRHWK